MSQNDENVPAAHVDQATIEVAEAELYISPGARRVTTRLAWSILIVFVVVLGVGLANLLWTNSQVYQVRANTAAIARANAILQKQVQADCSADRDFAGLPLANAPNGHPSRLGVQIISDFRGSWHRKGCPGMLPPPSPSFVAGAKLYHIPVN